MYVIKLRSLMGFLCFLFLSGLINPTDPIKAQENSKRIAAPKLFFGRTDSNGVH
ncbi:MAG: hypothetical protein JWQ40_348 [Segetibacter sp.]|nr:hypothetical protein [Segetibacter sp.]